MESRLLGWTWKRLVISFQTHGEAAVRSNAIASGRQRINSRSSQSSLQPTALSRASQICRMRFVGEAAQALNEDGHGDAFHRVQVDRAALGNGVVSRFEYNLASQPADSGCAGADQCPP